MSWSDLKIGHGWRLFCALALMSSLVSGCGGGGGGGSSGAASSYPASSGSSTTTNGTFAGKAKVKWVAPTQRSNGSALSLSQLQGYRIYIGKSPYDLTLAYDLGVPTATSYTVSNLAPGTYYFAVAVYDTSGMESGLSTVTSKRI